MKRNIKDRLYIATVCAEHKEIISKYGIGVELDQFCDPSAIDGKCAEEAREEINGLLGIADRCVLHAPFSELFPAAIDPKVRLVAMERLQQAAELAALYKAKKMIVHSGYVPLIFFKEWHEDRSVEFWEEFMAGREDGLVITVENVMDDEPYMMAKMMERIKNPNIKLCFDVGHAACISKVPADEWLEVLAPYLGHLHIHNNDGTHDWHKPIFEGNVDMEKFLNLAIEKCAPDTTITIESLSGLTSMEWLKERGYI
ncbi:MAG: sugar phosphate isomerase/epimerase family protein [Bacillota bacterium]|nr:sugar phosphate isomerase/epimerase family protein [Bacillota bacterium]